MISIFRSCGFQFILWSISISFVYSVDITKRIPCHDCTIPRETQHNYQHFGKIETHCEYPCECKFSPPPCGTNVPLIRDGCGCCWQCARQENEDCDGRFLCDASKGLACVYQKTTYYEGFCIVMEPLKCSVNNQSFHDGETFLLDCRTQCTCKNGTYACVSLCPGESIPPSPLCKNPRLATVPGQCCREWMCDERQDDVSPKSCEPRAGDWTSCSAHPCGLGISMRWFLDTSTCQVVNQSRLCQTRPCNHLSPREEELVKEIVRGSRKHHLRRYHMCKATQRYPTLIRLKVSGCVSDQKYRPKLCASCPNKCCKVKSATTIPVEFICPLHSVPDILREDAKLPSSEGKTNKNSLMNIFDIMDEGQPAVEENVDEKGFMISSRKIPQSNGGENGQPRSGILSEDFVIEDSEEAEDYWRIKNDNHETVKRQVQWIVRCKCSIDCESDKHVKT